MKFVPFQKYGNIETRQFLRQMVESSPGGQTVGQMRERLKLLKAIDEAPAEGVVLDDSEQGALLQILNTRPDFIITSADIIAIVDSVAEAKAPTVAQAGA